MTLGDKTTDHKNTVKELGISHENKESITYKAGNILSLYINHNWNML